MTSALNEGLCSALQHSECDMTGAFDYPVTAFIALCHSDHSGSEGFLSQSRQRLNAEGETMSREFLQFNAWILAVVFVQPVMVACADTAEPEQAGGASPVPPSKKTPGSGRTIIARVVALNQPFMQNRLGAAQTNGMVFALQRDVVDTDYVPAPHKRHAEARPASGKRAKCDMPEGQASPPDRCCDAALRGYSC